MTNPELRFARIAESSDQRLDELYAIYASSLPASERKSRAALEEMVGRADYRFLIATTSAQMVGFAIVFVSVEPRFSLLEYMAVDPKSRGEGIGRALLDRVRDLYCDGPASGTLLIEVESDREVTPDREERARRKTFYRRAGCREIADLDYVMPLPGTGPPPDMELMVCSADATEIPRARVRSWLVAIYARVYGLNPDDPRIPQMLGDSQDALRLT